ncbi:hypothetical protein Q5P01_000376 [Channa striata]|uniref:Uncharacterized protein n=1 Tax=Channa striata TaxID=64152 RepID=A0AA88LE79_CHASR|nr:hypothetical protein Q5P01_000376 [Channa striata]
MDVLMDMKRTDLVQKLRQTSSELKEKREEPESALFERVPGTDTDEQILLETLDAVKDQFRTDRITAANTDTESEYWSESDTEQLLFST